MKEEKDSKTPFVKFPNIHIGDTVHVNNRSDNIVLKKGYYDFVVKAEDDHSFAVQSGLCEEWWFYRDTGESYTGDAIVIERVKS